MPMKRSTLARAGVAIRLSIILAATGFCLYNFVIVKMNRAAELDTQIDVLSTEVESSLRILKSGRRLLAIEEERHREWEREVLAAIPEEYDANEVLEDVGRAAVDVGLKILISNASEPSPEVSETDARSKKKSKDVLPIYRVPINVEVTGQWSQIAIYLKRLRELPRQLRIKSVRVQRRNEFFPALYAKITLESFYCAREGVTRD